jgi:two-component system sensor histidine kinase SenX3
LNHGGDVKVWSKEGVGSTFTLQLPVALDEEGSAS